MRPERLLQAINNSDKAVLAWENDELVGLSSSLTDGINVVITYLVVHKNYQNKGIGSKLIDTLLSQYTVCKFQLCTSKANKFYEKIGFVDNMHGMSRVDYDH